MVVLFLFSVCLVSIERKRGTNQIMHQIVLGVEYIHKMDIIHRDLKVIA